MEKKAETSKIKKLLRWWPLPVYIIGVIVLILFIKSGDEEDLYKAHMKKGTETVTIGDYDYTVLSKEDEDSYIGSSVSDKLNAVKKDKIASLRSYLLYVSVFYSIEGDEEFDYVMDGKNTIYVKSELLSQAQAYYNDYTNINSFKITTTAKDYESMKEVSSDVYEMLDELSGDEVLIKDKSVTENYENRREIYGFYDNGLMYRAVKELFKYNNEIYLTTYYVDADDNNGTTVIKGIKLPEEYQSSFKEYWTE
jgi:3-methyladenine DNA glycosylase AlkC